MWFKFLVPAIPAWLMGQGADALALKDMSTRQKKSISSYLNNESVMKGGDYDHLRFSVLRIEAVASEFDWMMPFGVQPEGVGLGSGFVVETDQNKADENPIIITNAHVVTNAPKVSVQLLVYGSESWEARVVSICQHFDIAILKLEKPKEFLGALASKEMKLFPLTLRSKQTPPMGTEVVAMGFPLGQNLLKISKGVVAGNQEVEGNICIQSTAPISPGNSGGPLLATDEDGTDVVVGINFAKATGSAENINFVIPAWRVHQVIRRHQWDLEKQAKGDEKARIPIKIAMPDLTTIEGSEAIYRMAPKCKKDSGVMVTKVAERSFLQNAKPAIEKNSLLISVNDIQLDEFGEGRNPKYVEDQVKFPDLFYMRDNLYGDVKFQTCNQRGEIVEHVAQLDAKSQDTGIVTVDEPKFEANLTKYEIFGDISVMAMTVNHIQSIVSSTGNPGPARWLHPSLVAQPRLVINYVRGGSYGADVLTAGSVITKVNGKPVSTLDDFKAAFFPQKQHIVQDVEIIKKFDTEKAKEESLLQDEDDDMIWTLETDLGKLYAVLFKKTLKMQLMAGQMGETYMLSETVVNAGKRLGWVKEQPKMLNEQEEAAVKAQAFIQHQPTQEVKKVATRAGPIMVEKLATGAGYKAVAGAKMQAVDHLEM